MGIKVTNKGPEPKYFYYGAKPSLNKTNTAFNEKKKESTEKDLVNPLFNFDNTFTENFLKVQQTDLAQAVPYVRLEIIDLTGKTITDLNVTFFQKQIDFNGLNSKEKYADRPTLSLENIGLKTDKASRLYLLYKC